MCLSKKELSLQYKIYACVHLESPYVSISEDLIVSVPHLEFCAVEIELLSSSLLKVTGSGHSM